MNSRTFFFGRFSFSRMENVMTEPNNRTCPHCFGATIDGHCLFCLGLDERTFCADHVDRTEEIRDRDDSGRHRYAKRDDSTKGVSIEGGKEKRTLTVSAERINEEPIFPRP